MPRRSEFRIGKRAVEALRVEQGDATFWDRDLAGFGVRVHATGRKVYVVQTRGPDGPRRVSLGQHGDLSPDEARKRARPAIDRLKRGEDAFPPPELTVAELAERYLRTHVAVHCKPSSARLYRLVLRRHIVPALGAFPMASIGRKQVAELHRRLYRTPSMANAAVKTLSHMYAMAEAWGAVPEGSNPCRAVIMYPARRRERFLTDAEFERLGRVLDEAEIRGGASPAAIAAIRLLMLTGCRKNEILTLRWDDVDLWAAELKLADAKTGPRTVSLSSWAVRLLRGLPRAPGTPWVLPGHRKGRHLRSIDEAWQTVRARAGLDDVRLHDLRHSYASRALALGETLPMIGKLLGHSQMETTARYAHLARDSVRESAARIANSIADDIL